MKHKITLRYEMPCYVMKCNVMPCCVKKCNVMPFCVKKFRSMPFYAILCHAML